MITLPLSPLSLFFSMIKQDRKRAKETVTETITVRSLRLMRRMERRS
jgi:hypothetical protein